MSKLLSRALAPLSGAIAVFFAAAAYAAPMTVVSSNAPGITPGDLVQDGAALTVPEGATVQLFTVTGQEITVSGPFSGPPSGGNPPADSKLEVLASALLGRNEVMVVPGGVRDPAREDIISYRTDPTSGVGFSAGGNWCVSAEQQTVLVRDMKPEHVRGELKSIDDGAAATVEWTAFQRETDWPASIPARDGGHYELSLSNGESYSFTLRIMPKESNGAARLAQMAAAGCSAQVQAGLQALASASAQ